MSGEKEGRKGEMKIEKAIKELRNMSDYRKPITENTVIVVEKEVLDYAIGVLEKVNKERIEKIIEKAKWEWSKKVLVNQQEVGLTIAKAAAAAIVEELTSGEGK